MHGFLKNTVSWFENSVGTPTEAQTLCWHAVRSGENVLLSSPTGSGKTLAAFLYFLDRYSRRAAEGPLPDETGVLYISPLKSLGNDIRKNLEKPLRGLGLESIVRTAVRTGDTTPAERQAIFRKPPHILITTPESFYLLLSGASGRRLLKTVKALILDEFHATASEKRGVHMMLSVARLQALTNAPLQKIALSATLEPLPLAGEILSPEKPCRIIAPPARKKTELVLDTAAEDMRILPENSIWPCLADRVIDSLRSARSVLCFTDGRAGCERLAHKINERAGGELARTHHGCVSREQRLEAERLLKSGQLRVMAATGSMELGIDVGEIDEVIQIGNPLSVASLLQRLGRAGHAPGKTSRMRVYPKTAQDALACALTVSAAQNGKIEPLKPPQMCLDLLCQHLVSMAAGGEYTVKEATDILKCAFSYRTLTEADVKKALSLLAGDCEHALDRPVRARVLYDRIHETFSGDAYTRMLALSSGGTIPDRGLYKVQLADGTVLGELDEEYVFEARLGDKFMLGAFPWVITAITHDRVIVEKTTPAGASSPFWKGDGSMRAYETGAYFGEVLANLEKAAAQGEAALREMLRGFGLTASAAQTVSRVISQQLEACGRLATDKTLVFEHFTDEDGEGRLMVHSPFGGRVNRCLGLLLTREFTLLTGAEARFYDDDDGVLICPMTGHAIPAGLAARLNAETAPDEIRKALPATPMFSILFRQNAQRAMLMGARGSGRLPLWIQRLRATRALSDALEIKNHPMLEETLRECMSLQLDPEALMRILLKIHQGEIRIHEIFTEKPSPLCLSLRRQAEAELMYETVIPSAAQAFEAAAAPALPPEEQAVSEALTPVRTPANENEAHAFLMTTGDLLAGEGGVSLSLLESLEAAGRAVYLDEGLWVAAEHHEAYLQALSLENDDFLLPIARRMARYRGAVSAEILCQRYLISAGRAENVLQALIASGALVAFEEHYLHKDVYESAQRKTIAARRKSVQTQPAERYAQALLSRAFHSVSGPDETVNALTALCGLSLPAEAVEQHLLPARVTAYRPEKLDRVLSTGEIFYRLEETAGKPFITFYRPGAESDEPTDAPDTLTDAERAVFIRLTQRGASFARSLSDAAGGKSVSETLLSLLSRGLVRQDSFAPVRHLLAGEHARVKVSIRSRVSAADGGRWEAAGKLRRETAEEALNSVFDTFLIAARETLGAERFSLLLPALRKMEYAGLVRRGYFVQGMGGAQFVRESDYARVTYLLNAPGEACVCLNAQDPFQPYGKILRHSEGRQFLRLPSVTPVFFKGRCVCVFEKNAQALRVFEPESFQTALSAFLNAYRERRILAKARKITLKEYPQGVKEALLAAGFLPDSLYLTLYRD